jgi:hypothetical protein
VVNFVQEKVACPYFLPVEYGITIPWGKGGVIPPFLTKKRDAEFCSQIQIWAKFAKEER